MAKKRQIRYATNKKQKAALSATNKKGSPIYQTQAASDKNLFQWVLKKDCWDCSLSEAGALRW